MQAHSAHVWALPGSNHSQSLTAGNFEALWPIDLKFSAFKELNPFSTVSKVQEAGSILKVGFALSNRPHLHRAYLVTVPEYLSQSVYLNFRVILVTICVFCQKGRRQEVQLKMHIVSQNFNSNCTSWFI